MSECLHLSVREVVFMSGQLEQMAGLFLLHGNGRRGEVPVSHVQNRHPACGRLRRRLVHQVFAHPLRLDHHRVLAEPDAGWPGLVRPAFGAENRRSPALQPDAAACKAFWL